MSIEDVMFIIIMGFPIVCILIIGIFILFFCIDLLLSKVALPPGMVVSDRGAIISMTAIINAEIIFGQIGDRDGRRNRAKAGII